MDINDLRGLAAVFVLIAFSGICWWAFSPKQRERFNEAANLPFAEDQASGKPSAGLSNKTQEQK